MFWHGDWGWWWLAMPLTVIVTCALVTWIVVLATRPPSVTTGRSSHTDPEQILAERYARGELDDDEYRRRLATLRGRGRRPSSSAPT